MFLNIHFISNAVKSLIAVELVLFVAFYFIYKATNKDGAKTLEKKYYHFVTIFILSEIHLRNTGPISSYNLPQLNVTLEMRQEFLRRSLETINGVIKFDSKFCLRNDSDKHPYNKEKAKAWTFNEKKLSEWLFDFNDTKDAYDFYNYT